MTNVQQAVKRVLDIIGEPTFENIERFLLEQYDCPIVYIGSEEYKRLDEINDYGEYYGSRRGFTHLDTKYRVFLDPKRSDLDKLLTLQHELGHIECDHLMRNPRLSSLIEEREAEAFAYHLWCDAEERAEIYSEQNIGVVAMPLMQEV